MAKKKTKKSERKRVLKYGQVASSPRNSVSGTEPGTSVSKGKDEVVVSGFKRELRRNLIFVVSFFLILLVLYFLLTKTSLLDSLLNIFGLKGLYK